jgi:hydroxysqualene dehydroxylase
VGGDTAPQLESPPLKVAVVGAGWAGLAAAVAATRAGHAVTLLDMAAQAGGRARSLAPADTARVKADELTTQIDGALVNQSPTLDNGQHILIGAYTHTLRLMQHVGADPAALFLRQPLELRYPDGRGLRVGGGPALWGLLRGVWGCVGWGVADRLALLSASTRWAAMRFTCAPHLTVAQLCHTLPHAVRQLLIDPLCVAALNTPASSASAAVFLRVLRDALFSGKGSADLLLPRVGLSQLLPQPAWHWLQRAGAQVRLGHRVQSLQQHSAGWEVDSEHFDAVVLACTAPEAARLVTGAFAAAAPATASTWAEQAQALPYEPIVTVYLHAAQARLPSAMTALIEGPQAPAQFAFDHGAMGASPGLFAFVVSGARAWVDLGLAATGQAVLRQAQAVLLTAQHDGSMPQPQLVKVVAEKRATFRCTPSLQRPPAAIAPGLWAAGDYVAGPYPATLEGAVRSGEAAVAGLGLGLGLGLGQAAR